MPVSSSSKTHVVSLVLPEKSFYYRLATAAWLKGFIVNNIKQKKGKSLEGPCDVATRALVDRWKIETSFLVAIREDFVEPKKFSNSQLRQGSASNNASIYGKFHHWLIFNLPLATLWGSSKQRHWKSEKNVR